MCIYWPSAVAVILLLSLATGLFLSAREHRRLGQLAISIALGGFIGTLEILKIIRVDDRELRLHAADPGPLVIACNHPAIWDAPLVMRRFLRLSGIMKTELLGNPFLRNGARFAGFIPNSPRLKMIRMALDRIKSGGRLLMFPEGTRTRPENGAVNPFRPGLALISKQSGAPILPVFIHQDSPYLRKYWPTWKMPDLPITITIRVGALLTPGPEESAREFSHRLETCFRHELSTPTSGFLPSPDHLPGLPKTPSI